MATLQQKRTSLRDMAYGAIKLLIMSGQLPPGSRVTELELTERLGVSRTPVREALNQLVRDGLVTARAKSGFSVMKLDMTKAKEAFALREELEAYAVSLACKNATASDHARLRDIIAECDALAEDPDRSIQNSLMEMEIGIDLHRVIAELTKNTLLANTLNGILDRCQMYIWMDLKQPDGWDVARTDHRTLVEAICARDEAAAIEITRRHVHETCEGIVKLLQEREDLQSLMFSAQQGSRSI